MKGKPRSLRQAQALQTVQLRSQGRTWAEIAAVFRVTYRVNPRVALRQAHGWSQPQAAARWTRAVAGRSEDVQELLVLGAVARPDRPCAVA